MGGICGKQAAEQPDRQQRQLRLRARILLYGTLWVGGLAAIPAALSITAIPTARPNSRSWVASGTAAPSIGHLIGASETGAALTSATMTRTPTSSATPTFAGDPSEGKTERRQAGGRDSDSQDPTSFVDGKNRKRAGLR